MAKMTCKKEFRCTVEESKYIMQCAKEMDMTESSYMRYRLQEHKKIRMPPEITNLLQELKYYDLKIGININQVVRSCNSKKFITQVDYRLLVNYLAEIDRKYQEIIDQLHQELKNGNNKTSTN